MAQADILVEALNVKWFTEMLVNLYVPMDAVPFLYRPSPSNSSSSVVYLNGY